MMAIVIVNRVADCDKYWCEAPAWLRLVSEAGKLINAIDAYATLEVKAWPMPPLLAGDEDEAGGEHDWGKHGCQIELRKCTGNFAEVDETNIMGAETVAFPIRLAEFPAVMRALEWA